MIGHFCYLTDRHAGKCKCWCTRPKNYSLPPTECEKPVSHP